MPQLDEPLFLVFVRRFSELDVRYMVTGSVAAILYGEPRNTHDVDLVVFLPVAKCQDVCRLFPLEEFYCPPYDVLAIEANRTCGGHFNLIHHESGFKADVYLCGNEELHRWALAHVKPIQLSGTEIPVAPPEYVIIRKLLYFREGRSDKHLRDIAAMLRISGESINRAIVEDWVARLSLVEEWNHLTSS